MTAICTTVGLVCLAYYLVLVLYAGVTADFAWIWMAAAVALIGGGRLIRYGKYHPGFFPGWLRHVMIGVLVLGLVLFFCICGKVLWGMRMQGSSGLDYVVVLGAQVRGEEPSRALAKRLNRALEYAQENADTVLILSGGQGSGEDISEAECMRRWLEKRGIHRERLILEDKSTSTKENLEFSDRLTGCAARKTGILSNNFHVYRAVRLAGKLGYTHAEGIAAASDSLMQVHYVVREVFALVKEKLRGNI